MKRLVLVLATFAATATALGACAELDPATLITRDRVLAARVTVDDDPTRAWPAPGEAATMTWVTASPGAAPTYAWTLAACAAATSSGMPSCDGAPFTIAQGSGAVPVFRFTVPAEVTATAIVVSGVICASGAPVIGASPAEMRCDDGSRPELVAQHVFIARDVAVANRNPDVADAPFTLAGAPWDAAAGAGCEGLPVIAAGSAPVLLGVTLAGADRETFTAADATTAREQLQLAAFATAGELERLHTYVEAGDERAETPVVVEWTPPEADEVPAGGLVVGFHVVVRDLRGGVDAATRALCVK